MVEYLQETSRNRKLHLIKLNTVINGSNIYIDATRRISDAINTDRKNGYKGGGPMQGIEIEHAKEYASYIDKHITKNQIQNFHCKDYYIFMDSGE